MAINKNKVIAAAQKYVQKGQLDKAIKEYRRIVEAEPGDVRTWLKIGDLQAKKGSAPEATDTYLRVANHYSEQGFYLKAVAVYKQVLLLQPRFVEVHLKLAALYQQLGLLTDARRQLEVAHQVLSEEGRVEDSMQVLRAMTDIDPDNVAVRIRLAETLSKEKRVDEAVEEFTRAADILRSSGRMDDFIRVAERLIWHKPDLVALTKELATLYLRRQDPRRALQKLQVCYKADEKDTETLNLLVNAFLDLDQKAKAVTILKVLANVHEEKKEIEHGDDVFRRILSLDPGDEDALLALKQMVPAAPEPARAPEVEQELEELDEFEELEEIEELDELEELDEFEELDEPDSATNQIATLYGEAEVYEKFGLLKEAVEQLEQAKHLDPDNIETQLRLKELYVKVGNVDGAVTSILIVAGQKLESDPSEAEALLTEALEIDPGNKRVQEMMGGSVPAPDDMADGVVEAWDPAESDAQILDDIAAEAYTEEPEYATAEIDIEALERELEDRSSPSGFHPVVTQPELPADLSDGGSLEALSRLEDSGEFDLSTVGLEYLEQDFEAQMEDAEDDLLMDPLLSMDDDVLDVETDNRRPTGPMESELEVDLANLREGLGLAQEPKSSDTVAAQGDGWEEESGELSLDLAGAAGTQEKATRNGRFPDTAVVSREELDLVAEGAGDDDDQPLGDMLADPLEDDEIFRDELSQMQETAELVASLQRPRSQPDSEAAEPADQTGESDEEISLGEALSAVEDDDGLSKALSDEDSAATAGLDAASDGFLPVTTQQEDPAFADVDIEELDADMEGATFFIDQGLYEEAIGELRELIDDYGEHPRLMAKIELVKGMLQDDDGEPDPLAFDFDGDDIEIPVERDGGGRMNIPRGEEDAFQQFKDGVAKQVGEDDAETHFDVGIAYKEMGMFADAIGEFHSAMRPETEVQCHVMIAHCHRDQGDMSEAINEYKKALYCEQITDNEQVDLFYQMGVTYEELDDPREAVYYYDKVARLVAGYRDVDERLGKLQAKVNSSKSPTQNDVDSAFDELINADET